MTERELSPLERELAILRGIQWLETIDSTKKDLFDIVAASHKLEIAGEGQNSKKTYTKGMAGQNLHYLLLSIHAVLFQDSYRYDKEEIIHSGTKPGVVYPSSASPQLQAIMNQLAERFFHSSTVPVRTHEFPGIFAEYYTKLSRLTPFTFGNHETFCLFFTALTELANNRDVYLDLRRITPEHENLLQTRNHINPDERIQSKLQEAFTVALDNRIQRGATYVQETWTQPTDKTIELGRRRFLKTERDGQVYLITTNGGLVSLEEHIEGNGSLREKIDNSVAQGAPLSYIKIKPHQIREYVGTLKDKTHIDGLSVADGAKLICMDVNPITGLTDRYNTRLVRLLGREKYNIFELADDSTAQKIRETIAKNSDFLPIFDIAVEHVKAAKSVIDKAVAKAFEDKTPVGVNNNHVTITIGGAGSGKGTVGKQTIRAVAGKNYVTASIDDARGEFDIYNLMTELGHHADDYMAVSQAAAEIRKGIAKRAIDEGYHLLYDGSGIPWAGYAQLAASWKGKVDKIHVAGADCELYVPEERKKEFSESAIDRALLRLQDEKRMLPILELTSRHTEAPSAFLQAFKDPCVDEFSLSDRAGKFEDAYIIARKYTVTKETLNKLVEARLGTGLIDALKEHGMLPEKKDAVDTNVDFLAHKGQKGTYSILVINNVPRFIEITRKSGLKKDAAGPEQLPVIPQAARWVTRIRSNTRSIESGLIRDLNKVESVTR